jgi:hypothetical protein
VGLAVAREVAGADWYAFAALAIAFPLTVVWRDVVARWYTRGGQPAA